LHRRAPWCKLAGRAVFKMPRSHEVLAPYFSASGAPRIVIGDAPA